MRFLLVLLLSALLRSVLWLDYWLLSPPDKGAGGRCRSYGRSHGRLPQERRSYRGEYGW